MATSANAVTVTKVALTFDNDTISQYNLAYQQALQPHNAHATFFVNSGELVQRRGPTRPGASRSPT